MTTYNPPTDAELDPEAPWTSDKAKRMRDVGIAISEGASGAPKIQTAAIDALAVTTAKIDALAVTQAKIAADSVGQSQLKTTSGGDSTVSTSGASLSLPAGQYGFLPRIYTSNASYIAYWGGSDGVAGQTASTAQVTTIRMRAAAGGTAYASQRYVDACPPYNLGDGDIPHFIFCDVEKSSGKIVSVYAAPTAPWHMNGPTDIRADYYDDAKRGWRLEDAREIVLAPEDLSDYLGAARAAGWREITDAEVDWGRWYIDGELERFTTGTEVSCAESWKGLCEEQGIRVVQVAGELVPTYITTGKRLIQITQEMKQRDMPLIPHPFGDSDPAVHQVVMLDPVSNIVQRLSEYHEQGMMPNHLLHDGLITIDNEPLNRAGPPGVMVVRARWKLT